METISSNKGSLSGKDEKTSSKKPVNQSGDKLIDLETLEQKGGIIKNKNYILMGFVKSYLEGNVLLPYNSSLQELARFIASLQILYKTQGNMYKPMAYNSILTELSALSHEAKSELEKEKKWKMR